MVSKDLSENDILIIFGTFVVFSLHYSFSSQAPVSESREAQSMKN